MEIVGAVAIHIGREEGERRERQIDRWRRVGLVERIISGQRYCQIVGRLEQQRCASAMALSFAEFFAFKRIGGKAFLVAGDPGNPDRCPITRGEIDRTSGIDAVAAAKGGTAIVRQP